MIITPEPISIAALLRTGELSLNAHSPDPGQELPRADGLHLSTILRAIGISTGLMKDYDALAEEGEPGVGMSILLVGEKVWLTHDMMAVGLAWEAWLFRRLRGVEWQPGEIERDGIHMNPDGVSYGVEWRGAGANKGKVVDALLEECKFTYQGTNGGREDIGWYRKAQMMGYCRGLGMWDVDAGEPAFARVWMLHVNGNYREQRWAQLVRYWCEWQPGEVVGNWKAVLAQAGKMRGV